MALYKYLCEEFCLCEICQDEKCFNVCYEFGVMSEDLDIYFESLYDVMEGMSYVGDNDGYVLYIGDHEDSYYPKIEILESKLLGCMDRYYFYFRNSQGKTYNYESNEMMKIIPYIVPIYN